MKGLLSFWVLLFGCSLFAQTNERIQYKADDLFEFRRNGEKIRRLVGNVVFKQKTSTMYCDSAIFYPQDNLMEAFGRVRIVDDSVRITSGRLVYNGQNRTAKLREDVVYTKGEQNLYTDFLDYNMDSEVGNYFNRGKLKDLTNTLISQIGYFYGKQHYAIFWDSVHLDAPDYDLDTDTLRYNTTTKVAKTEGKTIIVTEDNTYLHANGGEFRTVYEQSQFVEGTVETTDYYMEGDELFFDDLSKFYRAKGNVKLTAKNEDVILLGDEGYADNANGISKIYGNALMKRILERDTFYMTADTLVSIESEYDSAKRILAYYDVKMWRYNLQGIADSASYFLQDSILYFYQDPVFWNRNNQIEADTIYMEIIEETIKYMTLRQKSFLISEDTVLNKNQIKGRHMKATFEDAEIKNIRVTGNGESIYYVLENPDSTTTITMGMNRILCSNMMLRFSGRALSNISFYVKPEAKFIPPHELTPDIQQLQGFAWRNTERPELEALMGGRKVPTVGRSTPAEANSNEIKQLSPEEQKKILQESANESLKKIKEKDNQ